MTFEIESTRLTTSLEKRIARLETLEEVGASTGGFWTLLEEQILTDDAQTVITFDNIDQSFETIVFLISAQWHDGGGSSPFRMRWNDVIRFPPAFTVGAYCWNYLQSLLTPFSFVSDYIELGDLSGQSDFFTTMVLYIPDYHRDDKITPAIWHAGGMDAGGTWLNGRGFGQFEIVGASTSDFRSDPITKITFASYGGGATVFASNSKFSLYGFGVAT